MTDWRTLTAAQRKAEKARFPSPFAASEHARETLSDTLALLKDDPAGQLTARKIAFGCYLINDPLDIAAHCQTVPTEIGPSDVFRLLGSSNPEGIKYAPRGLFYTRERTMSGKPAGWTAIDNGTGEAWTEAFDSKEACLEWLARGGTGHD